MKSNNIILEYLQKIQKSSSGADDKVKIELQKMFKFIFSLFVVTNTISSSEATRGKNYSKVEVSNLLELVERYLPLGIDEWQTVANEFNRLFPNNQRDAESLRTFFKKQKNKRKPTGKLLCLYANVSNSFQ